MQLTRRLFSEVPINTTDNDKQCPHRQCLNHNPEWENVGEERLVPNPISLLLGMMALRTYQNIKCCNKPMMRLKIVQTAQCKKYRRTTDTNRRNVALCSCCGDYYYVHFGGE